VALRKEQGARGASVHMSWAPKTAYLRTDCFDVFRGDESMFGTDAGRQ
jgi:hypothetical protein